MHRLLLIFATVLLTAACPAAAQDDDRIDLEISEDTTFFTGPVNEDGTIDYVAALNAHYGEGIANEENAYAYLARLFPPEERTGSIDYEAYWAAVFDILGIDPLDDRPRFVEWQDFAAAQGISEQDARETQHIVREGLWQAEDHPTMASWLELNDEAYALVLEAIGIEKYYSPLVSSDDAGSVFSALTPQLVHCRRIAGGMLIRFNLAVANDELDKAVRQVCSIDRFGYLMAGEPTFMGKLVAVSVRRTAGQAISLLCERGALSHEHAVCLIGQRIQNHTKHTFQDAFHFTDRSLALEQVQLLAGTIRESVKGTEGEALGLDIDSLFDVNQALRQLNGYYDQVVQIMQETNEEERAIALAAYATDLVDVDEDALLSRTFWVGVFYLVTGRPIPTAMITEAITLKLATVLRPSIRGALLQRDRSFARRMTESAAIALLGYRDVHGELPASLDALVPTYFEAVPVDPYTGEPLVYRVNDDGSALVYSIGGNFEDDGGVDDYSDGDIAIRIGPPPAE